jgi:pimeloyl-ACP methyl ester carboxylesterase
MHLVKPAAPNNLPLIVYATGDAGWKRGDRQTYKELKSWGYPVAGFGSPDYLKHLGPGVKTITAVELARDYTAMIEFAEAELGMSARTPVILVGVSRGAGLSVAVAAQESVRDRLRGVVAIGLTKEEEYLDMDDLYGQLPALGPLPLAVVQSTQDNYLPATQARQLFGADNDHRVLRAISARNHNFSDARTAMYDAIRASLAWIDEHA